MKRLNLQSRLNYLLLSPAVFESMTAPGSLNFVQVALKEMLVDMGEFKYIESVNTFSSQRLTLI